LEQKKVHRPVGDVRQALDYTLNQWPKFLRCLEDGALELDTNRLPHDATVEQAAALTPSRIAAERRTAAEQVA
jgi:hypothetical protein